MDRMSSLSPTEPLPRSDIAPALDAATPASAAPMTINSLALTGTDLSFVTRPTDGTVLAVNQTTNVVVRFAATTAVEQGTLGTLEVNFDDARQPTEGDEEIRESNDRHLQSGPEAGKPSKRGGRWWRRRAGWCARWAPRGMGSAGVGGR